MGRLGGLRRDTQLGKENADGTELFERSAASAKLVARRTGAATVLVSHRFSTVRMADLILVVSQGRVSEAGTHAELMAACGLFAELYGLQAAAYR